MSLPCFVRRFRVARAASQGREFTLGANRRAVVGTPSYSRPALSYVSD